jgi:hypothetical protein
MAGRILLLCVLAASTAACGMLPAAGAPTPDVSTVVAATLEAISTSTAMAASPTPAGASFSAGGVQLVIPPDVAAGATAESVAAAGDQNAAPWEVTPAYTRLTLQGYVLQDKFFKPQIMIYPAAEYAAVNAGASIGLDRLKAILANPSSPLTNDTLPRLPFANAEQIIGAQPRLISFKNGSGVRVVAEYAQGFAQINNQELFYHFEGLTADGKSYIVTTLPINSEFLAPSSDPLSVAPPDGVPFPGYDNADANAFDSYYKSVVECNASRQLPPKPFFTRRADRDSRGYAVRSQDAFLSPLRGGPSQASHAIQETRWKALSRGIDGPGGILQHSIPPLPSFPPAAHREG